MFQKYSPAAVLELDRLNSEVNGLLEKREGLTPSDRKRADLILAKMAALKKTGVTDDEFQRQWLQPCCAEIHRQAGLSRPSGTGSRSP